MMINVAAVRKLRELRAEQDRLLQTLEFYAWLEDHGTSWDQIAGIRPLDNTPRSRTEFKFSCRRHQLQDLWERYNHEDMVYVGFGLGYAWVRYAFEVHGDDYEVVRRPKAYQGKFIDTKLKTGEQLVLPWPPFHEDVIYNRKGDHV